MPSALKRPVPMAASGDIIVTPRLTRPRWSLAVVGVLAPAAAEVGAEAPPPAGAAAPPEAAPQLVPHLAAHSAAPGR